MVVGSVLGQASTASDESKSVFVCMESCRRWSRRRGSLVEGRQRNIGKSRGRVRAGERVARFTGSARSVRLYRPLRYHQLIILPRAPFGLQRRLVLLIRCLRWTG